MKTALHTFLSNAKKLAVICLLWTTATLTPSSAAQLAAPPEAEKIDEILTRHLAKRGLQAQPAASDEVFLRRLYLDVVGRLPTHDEALQFLNSKDSAKRTRLIDDLLASPGYVSHFFNYFADLLRLLTDNRDTTTGVAYADWVKQALAQNKPFDQMVRELLTAKGGAWENGAIGFYMRDRGMPLDHLAATVQVFLGTRIECAQCHNHPFDKWSQRDYYQMAAFTYGMDTRGDYGFEKKAFAPNGKAKRQVAEDRELLATVRKSLGEVMKPLRYSMVKETDKELKLPHDYSYSDAKPGDRVMPVAMFGHTVEVAPGQSRAEAFANWLAHPSNPRFTTVIANRLWKKVMGAGLIEPVDEMMDSTVPVNAELMSYLEQLMVQKEYNLKSFLRVLLNSQAYQRMPVTTGLALGESFDFTGPLLRRMTAEQVWDSVVTLIYGNLDAKSQEPNLANRARLAALQNLYQAITNQTPQELIAAAKQRQAEGEDDKLSARIQALTAKANEARKAGDTAKARQISQQVNRLRQQTRNAAFDLILGEEALESYTSSKKMASTKNAKPVLNKKVPRQQQIAVRAEFKRLEATGLSRDEARQAIKQLFQDRQRNAVMMGQAMRASELGSPAPRGHFLRLFGQSDRETIENANPEAAVPQALSLMNGPIVGALMHPSSALAENLAQSPHSSEQLNTLYLSLLTRYPTDEERQVLSHVVAERGERALEDIVHALLNTGEFLFVR